MFRKLDEKPIYPKNGNKYRNNHGTFQFRYGRWVKLNDETQKTFCKKCATPYEYSKLLQCMQCPKCTPQKIIPIIQSMILQI